MPKPTVFAAFFQMYPPISLRAGGRCLARRDLEWHGQLYQQGEEKGHPGPFINSLLDTLAQTAGEG